LLSPQTISKSIYHSSLFVLILIQTYITWVSILPLYQDHNKYIEPCCPHIVTH
jgi:hypothetical protein